MSHDSPQTVAAPLHEASSRRSSKLVSTLPKSTLLPSPALEALLGDREDDDTPLTPQQLVQLLVDAGHLTRQNVAKERWRTLLQPALRMALPADDPWHSMDVHSLATELAKRWDYNSSTRKWELSEVMVKLEREPFAEGAMRECYRMKKMSQVSPSFFYRMDWAACNNYVAKRYKKRETGRGTYFSDIEMQMLSKRLSRHYNALAPPKAVDFLHAFVIEVERGGEQMLFCVERAIERGSYVKHNNNAGSLDFDGLHRATPNAFSRFTFHASRGELMVVDIQGVDDVHSLKGDDFGDGNLGLTGLALFFSTSLYDGLCSQLGLPDFALAAAERARVGRLSGSIRCDATKLSSHASSSAGASRESCCGEEPAVTAAQLNAAAAAGDVERLRELVGEGKDAGAVNADARSALHLAASEGKLDAVRFLVEEARAPLVGRDRWGRTPLEEAEAQGHAEATLHRTLERRRSGLAESIGLADLPLELLAAGEAPPSSPSYSLPPPRASAAPSVLLQPASKAATPLWPRQSSTLLVGASEQREASAPPASLGRVHARLAELLLAGGTPTQTEGEADVFSAAYHLVCAAAAGAPHAAREPRALRDLRSMLRGLTGDEVLPGVQLAPLCTEEEQSAAAAACAALGPLLASAGDAAALLDFAEAERAKGELAGAEEWLRGAVEAVRAGGAFGDAVLHSCLKRLSEVQLERGEAAEAAATLAAAAEAARDAGAFKLGMKWDMEATAMEE
ncbi:hypothetical protein EMIHUDRAFT_95998 [Emiliania huxleyi CCMP1516]|uniref:Alpha-type protein kinase domain-containing protein n=2 Tax=Emiliania huxleyi TaxID=2903 RepID=A0A0D3J3Y4_EMIH1|nr:hypothetical protein EMIHUDRAFT_95998 [Emiliania huxleyi CCMP1516]EOD18219.1 hypothetical protein EMIHUDRAFT_95998 [Emiliania huxleyi CCMP1516]|eukprot:XP_005770648.1 hypothetical protein EMIHUDRAFT_95998 [Emiliania huxleyi CCMP1516]